MQAASYNHIFFQCKNKEFKLFKLGDSWTILPTTETLLQMQKNTGEVTSSRLYNYLELELEPEPFPIHFSSQWTGYVILSFLHPPHPYEHLKIWMTYSSNRVFRGKKTEFTQAFMVVLQLPWIFQVSNYFSYQNNKVLYSMVCKYTNSLMFHPPPK